MTDALERIKSLAKPPRFGTARWLRGLMQREKGQCTWCGGQVPRGCRSWCSTRCYEAFAAQCDPTWTARRIAWWLAGGRWRRLNCEGCGRDVAARMNAVKWLHRRSRASSYGNRAIGPNHRVNILSPRKRKRQRLAWSLVTAQRNGVLAVKRDKWELDHIKPVAEGGGCCGPEGLRVLCRECHLKETGALRKRLKKRR